MTDEMIYALGITAVVLMATGIFMILEKRRQRKIYEANALRRSSVERLARQDRENAAQERAWRTSIPNPYHVRDVRREDHRERYLHQQVSSTPAPVEFDYTPAPAHEQPPTVFSGFGGGDSGGAGASYSWDSSSSSCDSSSDSGSCDSGSSCDSSSSCE